jgi:hypothetical protein
MKPQELDLNRARFINALYTASGRTNGTYTNLWQEFCADLGANLRDTDGRMILDDCIKAIGGTESHLAEKHAMACMEAIRIHLMKGWE